MFTLNGYLLEEMSEKNRASPLRIYDSCSIHLTIAL